MYAWAISQKLPVNDFKWVENTSQFYEDFIKFYNEHSYIGYFIGVDAYYIENSHNLHNDLPFLSERMNLKKLRNF